MNFVSVFLSKVALEFLFIRLGSQSVLCRDPPPTRLHQPPQAGFPYKRPGKSNAKKSKVSSSEMVEKKRRREEEKKIHP